MNDGNRRLAAKRETPANAPVARPGSAQEVHQGGDLDRERLCIDVLAIARATMGDDICWPGRRAELAPSLSPIRPQLCHDNAPDY
jgi:hypothetical protein